MESTVENAFSDTYRRNFVQGLDESQPAIPGVLTQGLNTINADNTLTPADIQKFMTNLAREPLDADHPEHPSLPVRGGGRRPQQAGGAPHDLHGHVERRDDQRTTAWAPSRSTRR